MLATICSQWRLVCRGAALRSPTEQPQKRNSDRYAQKSSKKLLLPPWPDNKRKTLRGGRGISTSERRINMASQYSEEEDKTTYKVVVNEEEQYSIWPEYRENPRGWHDAGKVGFKVECLAYIKEVWTDMRPLSLRKKMEELTRNPPVARAIPQTPT